MDISSDEANSDEELPNDFTGCTEDESEEDSTDAEDVSHTEAGGEIASCSVILTKSSTDRSNFGCQKLFIRDVYQTSYDATQKLFSLPDRPNKFSSVCVLGDVVEKKEVKRRYRLVLDDGTATIPVFTGNVDWKNEEAKQRFAKYQKEHEDVLEAMIKKNTEEFCITKTCLNILNSVNNTVKERYPPLKDVAEGDTYLVYGKLNEFEGRKQIFVDRMVRVVEWSSAKKSWLLARFEQKKLEPCSL